MPETPVFLPYQLRWLEDESPVKIWEKSRRIGATYVQSFEDVRDIVAGKYPAVWFSSADESAAKEYIIYCAQWAKMYDLAARDLGEAALDGNKDIKAFQILFSNGGRINALSSSPRAFRSKGGKVVLDEFAWHEDQPTLWKAAKPAITWGFPMRILSTHNGKLSLYFRFIDQIKKGRLNWSLHTTDIFKAAHEGLVEKIIGHVPTEEEINNWIEQQKKDSFDEHTWLEEFCCIPVDEASAFLSYDIISTCESDSTLKETILEEPSESLFVGVDIGRKKDLTVIWIYEELGDVLYTRKVIELQNTKFDIQWQVLHSVLMNKNVRRCCIDATGIGMQLAETAEKYFGKYKVESVMFTGRVKEEMAYKFRTRFEDRTIRIPEDHNIREDFHSIRKVTTASNNIRFDVEKSDVSGHADRFWAAALGVHAAVNDAGPIHILSGRKRKSIEILKGY